MHFIHALVIFPIYVYNCDSKDGAYGALLAFDEAASTSVAKHKYFACFIFFPIRFKNSLPSTILCSSEGGGAGVLALLVGMSFCCLESILFLSLLFPS